MNNYNQHNENTPNTPQDDALKLSEEQQILLTAEALGQLGPGSDDARKAAEIYTGQHRAEADELVADTTKVADAIQSIAAQETALLAKDPARKEVRQAVLAAIAKHGSVVPAASKKTGSHRKKSSRRLVRWLSGLASLAAVIAVIVVMQPEMLQQPAMDQSLVNQANELSSKIAVLPAEGRNRSRGGAQAQRGFADEQQGSSMPAASQRVDAFQAGRSAGVAGDMVASDTMARQSGAKEGRGASAEMDKQAAPSDAIAAAPAINPAAAPFSGQALKDQAEMNPQISGLAENSSLGVAEHSPMLGKRLLARTEPGSFSRGKSKLESKKSLYDSADNLIGTDNMLSHREHPLPRFRSNGETYAAITENPLRDPIREPLSTFSVDVDTASYANVRRFLNSGRRPPRNAVRIEELVNYFSYDDPAPTGDDPFAVSLEAASSPWHADRLVVRIGLKARDIDRRERPAGNLVFLVDVSGSMSAANKLPLVKQSLKMLVRELSANDRISLVTYAGQAGLKLPSTSGDDKETILQAIDSLSSGGSTHGSAGIELAYEQAMENFVEGGANRVLLATDGDLNVGITSDDALEALIRKKAKSGVFLTVLGFGEGNLQDAKMERVADNGNGLYAYIDGLREARKVLVEQLTGSTITVAKDVKLQVEFNPATVANYRLIGYENRVMAAEDFRDDTKDAGEIGAGHSVTALYEVVPRGVALGRGAEPLKYQQQPEPPVLTGTDGEPSDDLLTVKLRWKQPDGSVSSLKEFPLADRGGVFEEASENLRFASAVASFGMLLRGSKESGGMTYEKIGQIAGNSLGADPGGYRAEFTDLVRKASKNGAR
ncbi:MAG: VWA domain-containing protein [Planctomycetaceae bacterium]|nr:VWA domain-containing protein [Planctomycetaceae bacterium]